MNPGERLFARYAYPPNELGYCGPAESAALFALASTGRTDADVRAIARRFSGTWPYAQALAGLAGIADPLDERVMRAYWTGGPLLDTVDREAFGRRLIELIGPVAGYWRHLGPDLLPEAAPTHAFHVFGVYPWSRLLTSGDPAAAATALRVLDACRIRWGRTTGTDGDHVRVLCRRLRWDGERLALAAAAEERVRLAVDGVGFVERPVPGEWLAMHWDWVCERLGAVEVDYLRRSTERQLRVTNARLTRNRAVVA